jgi:hypothetical protein
MEPRDASGGVENHDARPGVGGTRLAYGSRVQQDVIAHRELGVAGRRPQQDAATATDRHRSVRVPHYEDARRRFDVCELLEAGAGLRLGRDVLSRIDDRAVAQRDAVHREADGKAREQRPRVVVEHCTRPTQAGFGQRDAALVIQPPQRDQVVIAGDGVPVEREHPPHAFVGHRAVADQIAGAEIAVEVLGRQEVEDRVEGMRVAVDVGDDAVAHQSLTLNLSLTSR